MSFYQPIIAEDNRLHCKLYHIDRPLPLSDVLPILENLGLRVLGEFPYRLQRRDGRVFWIHDFAFTYAEGWKSTCWKSTSRCRTPSSPR